jgi:predicted nucleotidyltransferase
VPDPLFDIEHLIATLSSANVRYVLIGGAAMRAHGSAHVTDDVDVAYARDADNLTALVTALSPLHPRLRGVPEELRFLWDERTLKMGQNFTLVTDAGSLDLLGEPAGVGPFEELWGRAVVMELFGESVRVASIEDLIAMKKAAGRTKDKNHILELEQIRAVLAEENGEA